MNRRVYLAAAASAVSAGLSGCSAVSSTFGATTCGDGCDIGMTRNSFTPDEYEVGVGETVVWRNTSDADHTITALENSIPEEAAYFATGGYDDEETAREEWDRGGGALSPRETYEHTFEVPGTYEYICIPHIAADMRGKIVVTD